MIQQANPRSNEKVREKVLEILESGQYVKGPEAELFESRFKEISQTEYNYTVNSGTSALNLIFSAVDYPEGSNIIVPANSFMASSNAVETSGYKSNFCDIDPKTMNLDPELVEERINDQTRAILVVHLYGNPAPMDDILKIAKKYDLDVFEDSAQAHGALYRDGKVGSFGLASAFSLFPTKNLSVLGDGGIVCTNNKELGMKFSALRNAGRLDNPDDAIYFGFNYRLSEVLAGIGNVLFDDLDRETNRRRQIAKLYTEGLTNVGDLILPYEASHSKAVYHQYTVRTGNRDKLKSYLKENGIGSSIKYGIPLHLITAYRQKYHTKEGMFPEAEKASQTLLCLPMHPHLSDNEVGKVISTINSFYK